MPRKNVPGGKKKPVKPISGNENNDLRRKKIVKDPKYKKKAWLDEIDDDEDFDIFDRESEE